MKIIAKSHDPNAMYREYIKQSEEDYRVKLNDINHYRYLLNKIKFYIEGRRDIIQNSFGICIYNYWEWNTDTPDDNNRLINDVTTLYESFNNYKTLLHRTDYLEFIKYIKIIRIIKKLEAQLARIANRKDITCNEFKAYIRRYYRQVSLELLYGRIYKFSRGIGNLLIERIACDKTAKSYNSKKYIDWQKTKVAKAALITKGLTPYSAKDAELCEMAGKPYNGVPYIVYSEKEYSARVMLCDRNFKTSHVTKFKGATSKIHETQEEILKRCKTTQDIINLDYDLKSRLSLILKTDFSYTQKFIRNDEQKSVVSRKYCSPVRQQLQYK